MADKLLQARRAYDSFAAAGEATPLLPPPPASSRPLGGDPRRSAGCGGGAGLAAAASGMAAALLGFLCLAVVLVLPDQRLQRVAQGWGLARPRPAPVPAALAPKRARGEVAPLALAAGGAAGKEAESYDYAVVVDAGSTVRAIIIAPLYMENQYRPRC